MSFDIPPLRDLKRQSELEIRSNLRKNEVRFSFGKAIASVVAGTGFILHRHISWVYRQIFISTADEDSLEEWGRVYGLPRNPGTKAFGSVRLSGEDGVVILKGSELKFGGLSFFTEQDVTIENRSATVSVEADIVGSRYNLRDLSELQLVNPLPRVDSRATVASDGIANGTDLEDIELYRRRLLDFIQTQSNGGSYADYINWVRAVPGVSRAWVYREWKGPASVGVCIQESGKAVSEPISTQLRSAVIQALDQKAPVISRNTIVNSVPREIRLAVQIKPNNLANRNEVFRTINDFFVNRFEPAGFRRADASEIPSVLTGRSIRDLFFSNSGDIQVSIASLGPDDQIPLQRGEVPVITSDGITFSDG